MKQNQEMTNDKVLYIVRGLPGSGKSTFAKSLGGVHFEADMYFVDENGVYNFDPTKIKMAHNWCMIQTQKAMVDEEPKIVVSNTFTQEWEMETYFKLANENGYQVYSIIVENRHEGKNTHGVPDDKLQIMKDRFQIKLM
jgi:predicted kinase